MARKKFSTSPAPKKAPPGMARRRSTNAPLNARTSAHPKLVHGFLVRLEVRSTCSVPATKSAFVVRTSVKTRRLRPSEMKHEGPADDATFH